MRAAGFCVILFLVFAGFCSGQIPFQSPAAKSLKFLGTSYTAYSPDGKKIWEVHAASVKGDQQKVKGVQVRGTLFRKEKPAYYLKSPVAFFNLSNSNILFPDGVVLRGIRGEMVTVGALLWDADAKRFVGTKGVKVVRLNTTLQGDEMILKPDLRDLILEGHVRALVRE